MQNNTQTDKKTLKRREDLGWANLKNQLDIELPQKKKDKRVLWVVFLLGAGLFAGYAFFGPLIEMQPSIPEMSKQLPVSPSSVPDDKLMEVALQTNFNDAKEDAPLAKVDVSNTSQSPEVSTPAVQKDISEADSNLKKGILSRERSIPSTTKDYVSTPATHQQTKSKTNSTLETRTGHATSDAYTSIPGYFSEGPESAYAKDESKATVLSLAAPRSLLHYELLPYRSIAILGAKVDDSSLGSKILFKQFEAPVLLAATSKDKFSGHLQAGTAYMSDKHWTSSILAGKPINLSSKLYLNLNAGLAIQYAKKSALTAKGQPGSFQSSAPGALKQLDAGSLYTVNSSKVFLDASNSLTGYRHDTLFISTNDKVTYQESASLMGMLQAGLGWNVFPRFHLESGFDFRRSFSKNQDKLLIQYATPVNNGLTNSITNAGIFMVDNAASLHRTSLYLQAGYMLNSRLGLNAGLVSKPFQSGSGSVLQSAADRPNNGGFSQLSLKGSGQQPFIIDFNLRYRF